MDEHGEERPGRPGPSLALILLVVAVVAMLDIATGLAFTVECAIGDQSSQAWIDFCDSPLRLLPAFGAGLVAGGGIYAWSRARAWPLALGAAAGLGLALSVWVLMGDPAGNFDGLLTA